MCLLVVNPNLEIVNGSRITQNQRLFSNTNHDLVAPFVLRGWIIKSITPTRIWHEPSGLTRTLFSTHMPIQSEPDKRLESDPDEEPPPIEDAIQIDQLETLIKVSQDWNKRLGESQPVERVRKTNVRSLAKLRTMARTKDGPTDQPRLRPVAFHSSVRTQSKKKQSPVRRDG
jgi:hypothetical protein